MVRNVMLLTAVCLLANAGCGNKKEPAKEPAPKAVDKATQAPETPATPPPKRVELVTPDELQSIVVPPEGARMVAHPRATAGGDRVQVAYCLDKANAEQAAQKFKVALEANDWANVEVSSNPSNPDRHTVSGQRSPYRVVALTMRAEVKDCKASEDQTFVSVQMHKFITGDSAAPGATTPPSAQPADKPATKVGTP